MSMTKLVTPLLNRGESFRPAFLDIIRIRATLSDTPVLMLTATATQQMVCDIQSALEVEARVIAVVPDRYVFF